MVRESASERYARLYTDMKYRQMRAEEQAKQDEYALQVQAYNRQVQAEQNAQARAQRKEVTNTNISQAEKNKGGFFGAIGYALESIGLGLLRGLEGIGDLVVGGFADLIGEDEFAKKMFEDDWIDYNHANEWYNPSGAMKFVGDVASGVGQMLPAVTVGAFTGGVGSAAMFTGMAAGQSVSEGVKKTGELGAKEWVYGLGQGAIEGGIEALSGGIGGIGKKAGTVLGKKIATTGAGKLATTFVGEGLEEVASDLITPAWERITGVDKNAKVDVKQLPKTFLVGGTAGAVMGGGSRLLNAQRAGGFNNLNAVETAQNIREINKVGDELQAKDKLTDKWTERLGKERGEQATKLSKYLQRMNDNTRAQFIEKNRLKSFYNADGTLKDIDSVIQERNANRNKEAMSYSARELDLAYEPTTKKLTKEQIQVRDNALGLGRGNTPVVFADISGTFNDRNIGAFEKDGVLYIDSSAKNPAQLQLVHEVTHTLEGTKEYSKFAKYILDTISNSKELQKKYGNYDLKALKTAIAYEGQGKNKAQQDYINATELVSQYTAEMFSDQKFIDRLSKENRGIVLRMADFIKDSIKAISGKGDAETMKFLRKAERLYRNALNNARGGVNVSDIKDEEETKKAQALKPAYQMSLEEVEPIYPKSDKWQRSETTNKVKEKFPRLWDISASESDTRNPTQISGTVRSYRKVYDFLKNEGFDGTILDASSGLGYGTKAGIEEYGFKVDDIEPYPDKSYKPKYTDYSKLNKKYDVIISNAVLNVIPQDQRDALVVKMGNLLNDSGRIFVNVRGEDVKNASSKIPINEKTMEYYISNTGSYQKGFTKNELVAYLKDALGEGFKVEPISWFGKVSAVVTKISEKNSKSTQERYSLDINRNKTVQGAEDNLGVRFNLEYSDQHEKDFLKVAKENNISQEIADELIAQEKAIIDTWKEIGIELNSDFLKAWDSKKGKDRVFDVFKKQMGYDYAIEMFSMCKKGVPLFDAIDTLVRKEMMGKLESGVLDADAKKVLYKVLSQKGFQIPCAICYVEQARQREGDTINHFVNGDGEKLGWNQAIEQIEKAISKDGVEYKFPSLSRDIATQMYKPTDHTMTESEQDAFYKAIIPLINEEIRKSNNSKRIENEKIKSGKKKGKVKKYRKELSEITPQSIKESLGGSMSSNLRILRDLVLHPELRLTIDSDLLYSSITTENLAKWHPSLYTLFNSQGGVSGFKTKQTPVIYWGDLLSKKIKSSKVAKAGGYRNQSNSDYMMYQFIDYVQMFMDATAKKYPMHLYTKVPSMILLFGKSGIKMNASLIPKVRVIRNNDGTINLEETQKYAGLDESGNLLFDNIEGINPDEIWHLLEDSEYSKNVGGICIGYSDLHISKMLDDKRIQLIIGFHDKTNDGSKRYKGAEYSKNYNEENEAYYLDKDGGIKTVHINFTEFLQKAEKMVGENGVEYNGKDYSYDEIPFLATELYLDHCKQKGYTPAYNQFSNHKNFYKLLADYSLFNSEGKYHPQKAVQFNLPNQVPVVSQNGQIKKIPTKDLIKNELSQEVKIRDDLAYALNDNSEDGIIPTFIREMESVKPKEVINTENEDIRFSLFTDSDGNTLSKEQQEFFKDSKVRDENGNLLVVYHGTPNDFTVFDKSKFGETGSQYGEGIYLTPDYNTSLQYTDGVRDSMKLYANLKNPLMLYEKGVVGTLEDNGVNIDSYMKKQGVSHRVMLDTNAILSELGYDGILDTESGLCVAFEPNQVKNTTNKTPTESDDIRFSLNTETKILTEIPQQDQGKLLERKKEEAMNWWTNFQVNFSDAQMGVVKAGKRLGVKDIEAKTNYARAGYNAGGQMLDGDQYDINGNRVGDGFKKIWDVVYKKGDDYRKDFYAYLLHYHNIDRLAQGKDVFANTTEADSRKEIADFEKKYPEFKELSKKVWKYNDNLLQMRVDMGLISQESADVMRQMYPHYVPTNREMKGQTGIGSLKGKYNLEVKQTIKTAKGSTKNILPPDVIIARQTMEVMRAGRVNQLIESLYDAASKNGNTTDIEVIERKKQLDVKDADAVQEELENDYTDMGWKKNQVSLWHNGEKITLAVSTDVWVGLDAYSPNTEYRNKLIEGIARGNSLFKKLVTSANPFFLVRNFFRDLQEALFYSKHGIRRFISALPRAYKQIATNGEMWRKYKAQGGLSSGLFDYNTGIERTSGIKGVAKKLVGKLEFANMIIEQAPRLAEFMLSMEKGATLEQALLDSADVTTNFSRGGKLAKALNRTVMPFLNPSIQGWSKLLRTVFGKKSMQEWGALILKALILGIGVSALNDLLNDDDEEYQALSMRDKENYYLFKVGDGKFLKIPKGRVLSVFGSLWLRGKEASKGNGFDFKGWLDSASSAVSPVDNITRTIFSPFSDVATNTTWYGGQIEGQAMQNLSPENRYDEKTSSIAIALGKLFKYSPKKIHYLIDQYSGVLGDIVLPWTTKQSERGMFASNFTIDSTLSNKYANEFYDALDKATWGKNEGKLADTYIARYLNSVSGEVSDMYSTKQEIQASDKSKSEKMEQSKAIQEVINVTQKAAVDGIKTLEKSIQQLNVEAAIQKLEASKPYRELTDEQKDKAYQRLNEYYYSLALNSAFGTELSETNQLLQSFDASVFAYLTVISAFESDKDSQGKAIAGSKKKKVLAYINSLPITKQQKDQLMMLCGYSV
ncbi:MAG: hypothetical protein IJ981_03085 [Clostridia bacterium]|nr:hypothetical protein [Clostridia bacterium]